MLLQRQFKPFVLAETLTACALTGLHPDGSQKVNLDQAVVSFLILETCGEHGCPKKSGSGQRRRLGGPKVNASLRPIFATTHVENLALHVIGLELVRRRGVPLLLEDWELARVALSCHVALDMSCQEMHDAWWLGRR